MPDTTSYLYLGLGVVGAIVGLYIISLYLRFANARKDVELLESLQEE